MCTTNCADPENPQSIFVALREVARKTRGRPANGEGLCVAKRHARPSEQGADGPEIENSSGGACKSTVQDWAGTGILLPRVPYNPSQTAR